MNRVVLLRPRGTPWPGQVLMSTSPQRFVDLALIDLKPPNELEQTAYEAPFPDRGHRAAPRALAALLELPLES